MDLTDNSWIHFNIMHFKYKHTSSTISRHVERTLCFKDNKRWFKYRPGSVHRVAKTTPTGAPRSIVTVSFSLLLCNSMAVFQKPFHTCRSSPAILSIFLHCDLLWKTQSMYCSSVSQNSSSHNVLHYTDSSVIPAHFNVWTPSITKYS